MATRGKVIVKPVQKSNAGGKIYVHKKERKIERKKDRKKER
jgi:hypothetical protein